jgi:beta-lactamase superfamily II metal-dependent hydrolase
MLKLEILAAGKGDALILHHGTSTAPRHMVIDGGPGGTWSRALKPRLRAMGAGAQLGEVLPIELVMVSHLDDDHINGILAMLRHEADLVDDHQPRTIRAGGLWVNVFDRLLAADDTAESASAAAAELPGIVGDAGLGSESAAVIASVPQGRQLEDLARRLGIPLNRPFPSELVSSGGQADTLTFSDITVRILGPSQQRLDDLRAEWKRYLDAKKAKDEEMKIQAAAFVDKSIFNLSSIIALVEQGPKRILLTGDARGDDIVNGLRAAGLLVDDAVHLDVLKVPHHGSKNNVTEEFFRQVTADEVVICGDDTHDNPDQEMLEMLRNARTGAEYHISFSYRLPRLEAFIQAARDAGERVTASYRDDPAESLFLDLS